MSDSDESSLGFVADRSEFRRRSSDVAAAAAAVDRDGLQENAYHYSANLNDNYDDSPQRPQRQQQQQEASSGDGGQPSLHQRARRRSSLVGAQSRHDAEQKKKQPVRRRMARRPSLDAVKSALDNEQDLATVHGGGSRMARRPSIGSAHSYDAMAHAMAAAGDSSDDGGGSAMSPQHNEKMSRRSSMKAQRRPSMGSFHGLAPDGGAPGGGGGERRRRAQRRPSMGSLDPSMAFAPGAAGGDGGGERRAGMRKNSSSFGSMRHVEGLLGEEKPMEYQEMRKRVARRSSIEYHGRQQSFNSLDAMATMNALNVGMEEQGQSAIGGRATSTNRPPPVQSDSNPISAEVIASALENNRSTNSAGFAPERRRSAQASPDSSSTDLSSDMSHPLELYETAVAMSSATQQRRASTEAVGEKKSNLRDMMERRPSGSKLDMEGTSKRKASLHHLAATEIVSSVAVDTHQSNYEGKPSPSSVIGIEDRVSADLKSADAFHQSFHHHSSQNSELSRQESARSTTSKSRKEGVAKQPKRQSSHFVGWGDAGSVTESEYSEVSVIEAKQEAPDAEVYVDFTNRDDFRERAGSTDEKFAMEIEEEVDARRPWRKATETNHKPQPKEDGSDTNSLLSFNMDETDANVGAAEHRDSDQNADDGNNIDGIGARRRMSSGSIDFDGYVAAATNDNANDASGNDDASEVLSEFAYAQVVLQRNLPEVDDRPTRTAMVKRLSTDSRGEDLIRDANADSDESSFEDQAEAAAIIAQMYQQERLQKSLISKSGLDLEAQGDNKAARRASSLHLSEDSLDLRKAEDESSTQAVPHEKAAANIPKRKSTTSARRGSASSNVERPHAKTNNEKLNGSHSIVQSSVGGDEPDGKAKDTFEYWNDGYGDLDNSVDNRRALPKRQDSALMLASNPAVAYKMGKTKIDMEEAKSLTDGKDGRSDTDFTEDYEPGSFKSGKTVPASNSKKWKNNYDDKSNGSLLDDGFAASRKAQIEKLLGPKIWQRRKQIGIALGILFILVVGVSVGVSVEKKPDENTPTPSPTENAVASFPTRQPGSAPAPYRTLQTMVGTENFDHAGSSVSFSSLGTYAAVGLKQNKSGTSNSKGLVRVYRLADGAWNQIGNDIVGSAEGDEFGSSVSLSNDGQRVAIGAANSDICVTNLSRTCESSGSVEVYDLVPNGWMKLGETIKGVEKQDRAGFSVSLSGDGRRVAVGAPRGGADTGSVRVLEEVNGDWVQIGQEIFGDSVAVLTGYAVSLSNDGEILAVSSPRASTGDIARGGTVSVYQIDQTVPTDAVWRPMGDPIAGDASGDQSGESISLSSNGLYIAIGANGRDGGRYKNVGYCRVFRFDAQLGEWEQEGQAMYGRNQGEQLGSALSLSHDATTVACGGPNSQINGDRSGVVRVYENQSGGDWSQIGEDLTATSGSAFGSALSLSRDGSFLVVGAPESQVDDYKRAGFAEIFTSL